MNESTPYITHVFSVEVPNDDRITRANEIARKIPGPASATFPQGVDTVRISIKGCLTTADISEAEQVITDHGCSVLPQAS